MLLVVTAGVYFACKPLLLHALGWLTYLQHQRQANHPVPWQSGPAAVASTAQPTNVIIIAKISFDPIDAFLWPNMRFAVSYNAGDWFEPRSYLTDYLTDEAVQMIRHNRNQPFFIYLAHWGVHTPMQATKDDYDALATIRNHTERVHAAMVRAIDRSAGTVLQALNSQARDSYERAANLFSGGAQTVLLAPGGRSRKITSLPCAVRAGRYRLCCVARCNWPVVTSGACSWRSPAGAARCLSRENYRSR